jgi:hypothetical protein
MEQGILQDQRWGKVISAQLTNNQKCKVSGLTSRRLYSRGKPKYPFKTYVWHCARWARLGLFAKQAVQRLARCEWGWSPHISNINPPGVARRQEWRAILTMTLRRMRGHHSSMK